MKKKEAPKHTDIRSELLRIKRVYITSKVAKDCNIKCTTLWRCLNGHDPRLTTLEKLRAHGYLHF